MTIQGNSPEQIFMSLDHDAILAKWFHDEIPHNEKFKSLVVYLIDKALNVRISNKSVSNSDWGFDKEMFNNTISAKLNYKQKTVPLML